MISFQKSKVELASLVSVRYVLWDASVPLPQDLVSRVVSIQKAEDFLVLTML